MAALLLGFAASAAYRLSDESWFVYGLVAAAAALIGVVLGTRLLDRAAEEDERIAAAISRQRTLRMTATVLAIVAGAALGGAVAVILILTDSESKALSAVSAVLIASGTFRLGALGFVEAALRTHEIDRMLVRRRSRPKAPQPADKQA